MTQLLDYEVNIKIKLSALWGAVMSLYIYCDYFQLYVPGVLQSMIDGTSIFGNGDQGTLVGLSSFMLVTSLMICLSILLPPTINKWLNILVGAIMTVFLGYLAYEVGYYFYKIFATTEAILTLVIGWYAFTWPKQESTIS